MKKNKKNTFVGMVDLSKVFMKKLTILIVAFIFTTLQTFNSFAQTGTFTTLSVTGLSQLANTTMTTATLSGLMKSASLSVTGTSQLAGTTVSGLLKSTSLTVTGASQLANTTMTTATLSGLMKSASLSVTGASQLAGVTMNTADISGQTRSGSLIVTGVTQLASANISALLTTNNIAVAQKITANTIDAKNFLVNGKIFQPTASQWTTLGNNIYYNTGYVGIGTGTAIPQQKLHILDNVDRLSNNHPTGIRIERKHTNPIINKYWDLLIDNDLGETFLLQNSAGIIAMSIDKNGNVGIGTTEPSSKLNVCGTIRANEMRVNLQGCDFVFENNYALMSLSELEQFIKQNKRLPDIAPAKEMETADGISIGEMQTKLLQKIEEMTLYIIELKKMIDKQQIEIENLQK